ncbi:MAG TPA: baseplate J/gp47 family protein [Bacillota bacterium]|nr:baseplate J/gp47 family protein [Bacillota bacterium]
MGFTDPEISELAEFAVNPALLSDDKERLSKYSRPHLALLLTFLKLLQYPKEKFAELTEEKIEFFYRDVLKLEEKAEVPDQVHVIFGLARDVREHLLKKGTLLYAGKDNTGADVHYEVSEDIVLNNAEVTDIKTIHFEKTTTDLKNVHQSYNKGDAGFEKILCLALGDIPNLPPYHTAQGNQIAVDGKYLRTELYKRIKGKEKDGLEVSDANYILKSLCFRSLKDFRYCLNLYYREINRGYVGVTYPEDWEWEKVYTILEEVHQERHARTRRLELKEFHKEQGFEAMMEFTFGEPEPGNMLYKMPDNINTLEELAQAKNEAARKYIENKLCMTTDDFKVIMAKKDIALSSIAGDEVYTLLETAWTQKRGYKYPKIGSDKIVGYYADTIASADQPIQNQRFKTFGKHSQTEVSDPIRMGFALSSPLLRLEEGTRRIELVISCKEGTIDYPNISALLTQNRDIFNTYLSGANGWQQVDDVNFEIGKFIIKPELKTYSREYSYLVCDTLKYSLFDAACEGKYLVFTNRTVYKIAKYDRKNTKIFLKSVHLEYPVVTNSLIKRLVPKTFVAELHQLEIPEYYTGVVKSGEETFADYYQGKYFLDHQGKIFIINNFIDAKTVEVGYCGAIQSEDPQGFGDKEKLLINKVWETIEPEYEEIETNNDISDLTITGISAAEEQFSFEVADNLLKIVYPEGKNANELYAAWEAWKDNPLNQPGRYEIQAARNDLDIPSETKIIERTGEVIKRYESGSEKGLRVTYRGRPKDIANLAIAGPSAGADLADFLIAGNTLTITPGKVSQTANQIAADWQLWLEQAANKPKGFQIESKDDHLWEAVPVSQVGLSLLNKEIKKCEVKNSYGVGIRVWYTGPKADEPRLILKENTIDLFEFEIAAGQKLTIKYPSLNETSSSDLIEAWREWKASPLNDPGNFDIEPLGDGLWTIQARTERELQPSENRIIECTLTIAGVIARYQLADDYENAKVEFIQNETVGGKTSPDFSFNFSDSLASSKTKILTIHFPPLQRDKDHNLIQEELQRQQVQKLLFQWNREYKKYGFQLIRESDQAMWKLDPDIPKELSYDFATDLNYVATIDPDGFVVKYTPNKIVPGITNPTPPLPNGQVVIHENETETESFVFDLTTDYPNNSKILFIKYPTDKKNRTVAKLLEAWRNKVDPHSLLARFDLVKAGTGKWEITALTEAKLASNLNETISYYGISDDDGVKAIYQPVALPPGSPFTKTPKAKVVFSKNDSDKFAFSLTNDYSNNLKVLGIEYPVNPANRKVDKLIAAWGNAAGALLEPGSLYWKADGALREFELESIGTGAWVISDQIIDLTKIDVVPDLDKKDTDLTDPSSQVFYEYKTSDVNGFTVSYAGHPGVSPQVTFEVNEQDIFVIEVTYSHDPIFHKEIGESLKIKYPARADKRRIVDLLIAWHKYKKSITGLDNYLVGFEITDTSPVMEKRTESGLLPTGDQIRQYWAGGGNGLGVSYIGHRDDPALEIAPIIDFAEENVGKKVLWDNGQVFLITGRIDNHYVSVEQEPEGIYYRGPIKLYDEDAIRFEALKFTIQLDQEFPPVIAALTETFSTDPAVKILLDNSKVETQEQDAVFYEYFKSICMERVDIRVSVMGLKSIQMRGNIAMINPANAFNPFGLTPDPPARFYFANREICEKRLDELDIHLDWAENEFLTSLGLPDMEKYYFAYSHSGLDQVGTIKNKDFEVKLQFLDRRTWVTISETPQMLFSKKLSYHDFENQTYQGVLFDKAQDLPKDPLDWARYYKLELSNQGFMKDIHRELMNAVALRASNMAVIQSNYSTIQQEIKAREEQIKAAKRAEAEARENDKPFSPPVIPAARELPSIPENDRDISALTLNTPYTPTIRSMSIDYTASAKLRLDTAALDASSTEVPIRLFRFHPFGFEEMGQPGDPDDFLLPQFDMQGYLFLGIRNVNPLQTVSLLVQMVSGSGDVNLDTPEITWSYLAANKWRPFKQSEILKDKTYGLQNTGITRFNIPAEATLSNTILPGARLWICAAAPDNIDAVPDTLDIRANSICITYQNQNNDPDRLITPLGAYTIKEMAERDPAIYEIIQPYTSFNGKRREQGIEFYIRVSERLKHKNRALTLEDYEKMILAQFPQIYKVKCVPQDECARPGAELLAPEDRGEIIVIVILKNSNSTPFFPLKPKTPANILEEIQRYIQSYMPPLVKVTVKNPRFEEIKYRLAVKFKDGYDRGYYINTLNEDIKRFLSPWAYDKEAEVSFGTSVFSSSVINFIENTDYVDYVANFSLLQQIIQHEGYLETIPLFLTEDNAATVKYPDSILVSAESHIIDVITTDIYDPGAFNGIGHMQIGTDFWIARPGPIFAVGVGDMELEAWPVFRYAFAGIPEVYFTALQSQQIWNILKVAGYLDNEGNVSDEKDINLDYLQIMVIVEKSFENYVSNVFGVQNGQAIKQAVVEIILTGLHGNTPIVTTAFMAVPDANFSAENSRQIWNTLKASGYLDSNGHVVAKPELEAANPQITVQVEISFEEYLGETFGLSDGEEINDAVVEVLQNGLNQPAAIPVDAFADSFMVTSREDSEEIWNTLKVSGYLDAKGNVLTVANLANQNLPVLVGKSFRDYVHDTFKLDNGIEIQTAVVAVLKASLNQKTPLLPNAFVEISGTSFSEGDSRQIWNNLKIAGYLDNKGNVLRKKELEVEDPQITVLVEKSFENYLTGKFKYLNTQDIKAAVVQILQDGLGFSGISQYPFLVY